MQLRQLFSVVFGSFCSFLRKYPYLCTQKTHCYGLSLALLKGMRERKVRAAQGAPLPKVEAIGDSRCRQKKTTAFLRRGKGEKVV